ncbi:MAG: GntR family transcriptional regulator [Thermomicrobiales bacterium]|nr:GntR family transcriptional regulator [Thermomicrobiales bacterium]
MTERRGERDLCPLDPADPTPLYVQLYRILRQDILDGAYRESEAIPSETTLQRAHGITRGTVRHAVSLLVDDGLVRQVRGKGTLVSYRPITYSVWNFGSFTDFSKARGQKPITRLIEREIAEDHRGRRLRMVRARGVTGVDGTEFLNIDTSWLSLDRFPRLDAFDFETASLYQVLREEYGVTPARSELTLSAVPWSGLARETFGAREEPPGLLCASGRVFSDRDELVEETSVVYSPDVAINVVTMMGGGVPMPNP